MRMRNRIALFLSAILAVLAMGAASAWALPGDPGVQQASPFRLNPVTLEPGARLLSAPDAITGTTFGAFGRELRITVAPGALVDVDQVLVPRLNGGYQVYDTFDNTGSAETIGPGYTAVSLFAPKVNGIPGAVDLGDVIVVVSRHGDGQNEPYVQEANEYVAATNRPIMVPKVTALGVSAIGPLHTYKIGFGYGVERWYAAAANDTFGLGVATVTDPNAGPSPTFFGQLPTAVDAFPRAADFPYDAQRVNDVDKAGESWAFPTPADGQTFLFKMGGDDTAWLDSAGTGLLTTLTQGDLPISWTVRASLAPAAYLRTVSFTEPQLRAWENEWFLYLAGKGAHPALPLAPGTNSPVYDGRYGVQVQPAETRPASGASQVAVKGVSGTLAKGTLRSAKIVRVSGKRMVRIFVRSQATTARVRIRMYSAKGHLVRTVVKTVKTNRAVRVPGLYLSSKIKTVKVAVIG